MEEYKEVRLLMSEKIICELQELINRIDLNYCSPYDVVILLNIALKLDLEDRIEKYYRNGNKDIA